jgi:hypothetical protein
MQPDTAASAVTDVDREAPHDIQAAPPPEPVRRRRWRWTRPGHDFLDQPGGNEYATRWQTACGQGG